MASQHLWFGGDGNFGRARNWSPNGVPRSGDTAIITAGTVHARNGSLQGVDINIGAEQPVHDPVLALRNETLGNVQVVTTELHPESDPDAIRYADITVAGRVTAAGTISVGETSVIGSGVPGNLDIRLARGATLHVTGGLNAAAISVITIIGQPRSTLVNDGQFSLGGASLDVEVPVSGNGTFVVDRGKFAEGSLTFDRAVSAGEHITVGTAMLNLVHPMTFLGSISETPPGEVVLDVASTSSSYANGILTVLDNHKTVAKLHITSFEDMGFNVASQDGQTLITTPGPIGASNLNHSPAIVALQSDHQTVLHP